MWESGAREFQFRKSYTLPSSAALLGNSSHEIPARSLGVRKKSEFISKLHDLPGNTDSTALLIRSKTPEPISSMTMFISKIHTPHQCFRYMVTKESWTTNASKETITLLLTLFWSGPANFTHLLLGKSCGEKPQECYTQLAFDTGSLSEM